MAILKKLLFVCLPAIGLTGCYTDFNPDEYSSPVLCLNSVVTAGAPIEVSVSHTWRYNNPAGSEDCEVRDARISIYVNGDLKDADYIAAEGDEIRIVAESMEYGKAEACVKVPYAAPMDKVEFIPHGVRVWDWNQDENADKEEFHAYIGFDFEVRIGISDRHPGREWFRLRGDTYSLGWPDDGNEGGDEELNPNRHASLYLGALDYNSDMIFKEHIGIAESVMGGYETLGLFFTDNMFSDSGYTVSLRFYGANFEASAMEYEETLLDCGITFTLMSISESYYNRMNYLWQKNSGIIGSLSDLGLSDPTWGFSNVSTGAGVVAAKAIATYDLNLKEFLQKALEEAKE